VSEADGALQLAASSEAGQLCRAVADRGGRALVVGGWVRDRLLDRATSDLDLEVHGLSREGLEELLGRFGPVRRVGASFDVYLVGRSNLQVSLVEPGLGLAEAASRRDLTVNSMAFDPLTEELLDPHGGAADLSSKRLRATRAERFGDDPLRVFRVARLAATLEFEPTSQLLALCRDQPLDTVAPERIYEELCRLLLEAARPSLGLVCLRDAGGLRALPEIEALIDVPQNPQWHPEGCVFVHTAMVIDQAARLRVGRPEEDLVLMFAALFHDLGKPATTRLVDGAVRARGHELAGVDACRTLMLRLRASARLVLRVTTLVRHHLAPLQLAKQRAGGRAYRKLARSLADGGVDASLLERLARADQLGRTTPEALAGRFEEGDRFLEEAARYTMPGEPANRDVVLGRHVLARGLATGPEVGRILDACRDLQDETGLRDPQQLLDLWARRSSGIAD
jgi:tRNA nucleotidyltransferase (CCA-adding enzyme)